MILYGKKEKIIIVCSILIIVILIAIFAFINANKVIKNFFVCAVFENFIVIL